MGAIRNEDVIGYFLDENMLCLECGNADDVEDRNELILSDESDEWYSFCDRCGKRIE